MAALFTLLLGVSALLLGYFLYSFGQQNFIRESEAAIDMEMERVLRETKELATQQRIDYIDRKASISPNPVYFLQDKDEVKLAGNLGALPEQVSRLSEGLISFVLESETNTQQMAAKIHTYADGARLLIGRDITDIMASHARLKLITALVMGFMLLVVLVSFFISVFVVGRINTIATTARVIMETDDLSKRIAVDGNWDDLSNLAQILNTLLEQIESLMQGIRDVSDSIAHDLRTPLTRLRNQLEAMQETGAKPDDIKLALMEADGLLNTFQALLRIANIEKGKRYQAFSEVDVSAILQDVIELYEPLAEEKSITLNANISQTPPYQGDRDLLFQAFANVLDNAIKYAPAGDEVEVSAKIESNRICIVIADKGEGVSEADRDRLFERFYRADKSRTSTGTGLGLSLVKAVIELHKAEIRLEDNKPGLCVVMQL